MAQCSSSLQNDWGERIYMKRLCNSYHTNDRRSFQCTQLLRWSRLGLARLGLAWLGITCTRPPNRHIYTHVCIRMHYKGKPFFLAKSKMKIEWLQCVECGRTKSCTHSNEDLLNVERRTIGRVYIFRIAEMNLLKCSWSRRDVMAMMAWFFCISAISFLPFCTILSFVYTMYSL